MLKALEKQPGAILFIDEIHTIVGAGATSGGTMDASNLLKPALASGRLRCIGATTFQEYRGHLERDRALARRFQRIEVGEPSSRRRRRSSKGLQKRYEEFHGVTLHARGASRPRRSSPRATSTTGGCPTRRSTCSTRPAPPAQLAHGDGDEVDVDRRRARRRQHGADPAAPGVDLRQGAAPAISRRRSRASIFGQDEAIEQLATRHQALARRPPRAREADRLLPLHRPHRRRQDRARQAARQGRSASRSCAST